MNHNDFSVQSASDLLNNFFNDILLHDSKIADIPLENKWKKVLSSIRGYGSDMDIGEKLAAHSRIIDLKNDILFLETDHSGWIQLFYLHKKSILRSLKKEFPELTINGFSFTLKSTEKKTGNELRNITIEEKERWLKERGL